ncbi:hypothetical protein BLGI_2167 [Brevibacillus laterosporus GI-9]|nr:hypothetical protein BLGI_2167 [Brevibacillus laterosporus GI-9]
MIVPILLYVIVEGWELAQWPIYEQKKPISFYQAFQIDQPD